MGKLTVRKIEAARPGIHGDGDTLYLRVRDGGSRQWIQIVSIDGKRAERGLGGYPRVSLREAREIAFDNRRGRNPFDDRPKRRTLRGELDAAASNAPTFREAFRFLREGGGAAAAACQLASNGWRLAWVAMAMAAP